MYMSGYTSCIIRAVFGLKYFSFRGLSLNLVKAFERVRLQKYTCLVAWWWFLWICKTFWPSKKKCKMITRKWGRVRNSYLCSFSSVELVSHKTRTQSFTLAHWAYFLFIALWSSLVCLKHISLRHRDVLACGEAPHPPGTSFVFSARGEASWHDSQTLS